MHLFHHHLNFLKNRELNELYISVAVKSFAVSMISIFIPIFLIKDLNYSLTSVLIFFAILSATHAIFVIPAAKIASKYGFKHSILYSVPILIVFYFGLYTIEQFHWPIYLLAVIFGVNSALYWIGYHIDFSIISDRKNRGAEISTSKILSSVFLVLGPIIGGVVVTFLGFKALFIFVSLLLLASTIPLFFSKDIHKNVPLSIKEIFRGQKIKDSLVFLGHGIEGGASSIIWPIFIFFNILNSFTTLGFVFSLSLLSSSIFVFIICKFSDINRRLVLRIGALTNSIIWGVRFFIKTTFQVFIIDSFYGVSKASISIPFDALSYDKANKSKITKFIMFRETMINTGSAILFLIMALLAKLTTGFLLGGGVSLGGGASLLYFLF